MHAAGPKTELSQDAPTKNKESSLEIEMREGKRYASFNRNGFGVGILMGLGSAGWQADKNMGVLLETDPVGRGNDAVLQATTIDDHPLIGARKWGATSEKNGSITLWTESYDIAQSDFIRGELAKPGDTPAQLAENPQFKLWNYYLKNLIDSSEVKDCVESSEIKEVVFKRTKGGEPHPWRNDLR